MCLLADWIICVIYRFVDFETDFAVNKAVQMFDGQEFNGNTLKVTPAQQQQQQNFSQQQGTANQNGGASGGRSQAKVFGIPEGTSQVWRSLNY